jgi:hypothetical protein
MSSQNYGFEPVAITFAFSMSSSRDVALFFSMDSPRRISRLPPANSPLPQGDGPNFEEELDE